MPSDSTCLVINAKTGYSRVGERWILNRILDDYEYWMDPRVRTRMLQIQEEVKIHDQHKLWKGEPQSITGPSASFRPRVGLCVSIYEAGFNSEAGRPALDFLFYSGIGTTLVQLGIAAIPVGIYGDWSIIMITAIGTALSYATGSLPQWKNEKWACRRHSRKTVILTKGNGAQHAIVIFGNGHGLDLEDLAAPNDLPRKSLDMTSVALVVFAFLWSALLITVAGKKENVWYLVAVCGLGTLQNVFVANFRRHPSAYGIHLNFVEIIARPKVMDTLVLVEEKYANVGRSMLEVFFPGNLRPNEQDKWDELRQRAEAYNREKVRDRPLEASRVSAFPMLAAASGVVDIEPRG